MAHLPSKVPLLLSYAALATNKAASFVSILFLCGQYNFKGELSGERGGEERRRGKRKRERESGEVRQSATASSAVQEGRIIF